nr:MAG TPA: hypothetical protein [Caudoviricetes sp.]
MKIKSGLVLKIAGFATTIVGGIVTILESKAEEARQDRIIEEKVNTALATREED